MTADDFARTAAGSEWIKQAEQGRLGFVVGYNCGNGWLLPPFVAPGGNGHCSRPTWVVTAIAPGGGGLFEVPSAVVSAAAKELMETLGVI